MLKLTIPKSFLRYAKNMTVAELKNVTDKDLMEYQTEWTGEMLPSYEADTGYLQTVNTEMETLAIKVYGADSKQHKYLYRNFAKGESVVDTHYHQYPNPEQLQYWVENSKTNRYDDACVPAQNYEQKDDN